MTAVVSKQLQPVFDKPMIYYPLCTLMQAGIRDVLLISTPEHLPLFEKLLGNGDRFGISISYATQQRPNGIAEALIIAEDAVGSGPVTLILGDNLFHGEGTVFRDAVSANTGATIFGYRVVDPHRYGVVELDGQGAVASIEEKPTAPRSSFAIPGFYIYDAEAGRVARSLKPSARGELEITDVHRMYHDRNKLSVHILERGVAWLDTGTPQSLLEATTFIHAIEHRQGIKIGCPEEVALRMGYLDATSFMASINHLPSSAYREYCEGLVKT